MLLLVPFVGNLSIRFTHEDWYLMDEGSILYAAFRSSIGELPHINSPYYYSGGFEILLGLVFKLFGTTFFVARWLLGVNMAATASLVYLLCTRIAIDRPLVFVFTTITTLLAYGMNFHVYPAWFSIPPLLAAVLFLWLGFQRSPARAWFLLSGVCLGVASSFKQTAGLYGLCAFILFVLIAGGRRSLSEKPVSRTSLMTPRMELAILSSLPFLILGFFLVLLRDQLTPLNLVMFLTVPTVIIAFCLQNLMRAWREPAGATQLVFLARRTLIPIIVGAAVGFMPLVLVYAAAGGLSQFVADSFLNIQQVAAGKYSVFKFAVDEATSNLLLFVRWFSLFVAPLAVSLLGLILAVRRDMRTPKAQFVALGAVVVGISYLTLYPIAIRMYVLFLAPLVVIPAAVLADSLIKRFFVSPVLRFSIVIAILGLGGTLYLGNRHLTGDLSNITSSEGALLDEQAGNVVVPQQTTQHLKPVLIYLKSRPPDETFIAVDVFHKLMAFVTRRKIETEYFEGRYFGGIVPESFAELERQAEELKIDTVVIGKNHLSGSGQERVLFEYLESHYALVIDNGTHLVFQRKSV